MTPSPWLYTFLKSFEQFRPTAYQPTRHDKWTAGWGHTRGVTPTTTCTTDQAQAWLEDDVHAAVQQVSALVHVLLTQNQFDALVSLVFNCGEEPLLKTLGHCLNQGQYGSAADQFRVWDHQNGVAVPGLTRRREAERDHFLS